MKKKHINKSSKEKKHKLQDIINSNLDQYEVMDKFLILTYAHETISKTSYNYDIQKFIKLLRRKFPDNDIQYIAFMGAKSNVDSDIDNVYWNILIFNMPYVDCEVLAKWWKKGIVWINPLCKYSNISEYLTRHINDKEILSLENKKRYIKSKGLRKVTGNERNS